MSSERMMALVFSGSLIACVTIGRSQEFFNLDKACTEKQICARSGTCEANSTKCSCYGWSTAHGKNCVSRKHHPSSSGTGNCTEAECSMYGSTCLVTADEPWGTCVCPLGTVLSNQKQCSPSSFNMFECTKYPESPCSGSNGVCTANGACLCNKNYYNVNNQCVQVEFAVLAGCSPGSTCGGNVRLGKCQVDTVTCVCEYPAFVGHGARHSSDYYCLLYAFKLPSSDHCRVTTSAGNVTNGTCSFGNGRCGSDGTLCTCNPGYVALGGMCVSREIPDFNGCKHAEPCAGENSMCWYKVCKCISEHFAVDGRCVKAHYRSSECRVTANSDGDKTCSHNLGRCHEGICLCAKESWFDEEQKRCVSGTFHDPSCDETGRACGSVVTGTCVRARTCRCDHGYFLDSEKACIKPGTKTAKSDSNLACVSARSDVRVAVLSIIVAVLVPSRLSWPMTSK